MSRRYSGHKWCAYLPNSYQSDSLWNYAIGAKTDGRLMLNPSLYHVAWSDIQTRVFVDGAGFNGNAGKAHITNLQSAALGYAESSADHRGRVQYRL